MGEMRSTDAETFRAVVSTVRTARTKAYEQEGGPVHPSAHELVPPTDSGLVAERFVEFGLTLRDYFAAKALAGLLSQETEAWHYKDGAALAARSYEIAGLMLEARKK